MIKKGLKYVVLLAILLIVYAIYSNYPRLNIIAGYSAKNMNSSVFLAGRNFEFTDKTDNNFTPINIASDEIDSVERSATASVYGLLTRKAIYREGLGSVLVTDDFDDNSFFLIPKRTKTESKLPFPYGNVEQKDTVFTNIDYKKLHEVVEKAFKSFHKTRSVLIVYRDQIIVEKYADKFNQNAKLLGWSMAKSITGTVFGILQKQGRLHVNDKALVASWKNDERKAITLHNLLQMNSGLAWEEDYNTISDVTKMLFLEEDMGVVQEEKELAYQPNTHFNYSSGTTNLLSKILREQFSSHQEYLDFWYTDLIDKIGMNSMIIEADISGTYVGSSYGWATTRDWAKFGLLYLHKGNWNGEQLFDESWIDYVTTPTPTSNGEYGAQFWLNTENILPDVPLDTYYADGYQGQRLFIIPSKDLVVVRMGLNGMDFNFFLKEIVTSIN